MKPPFTVGYDGPSRPMILSDDRPMRMFSLSEYSGERNGWGEFDDEDAFAERIAACLTACAGIPTADLQNAQSRAREQLTGFGEACRQRDEVAAALRDIADAAYGTDTPKLRERARRILAQVGLHLDAKQCVYEARYREGAVDQAWCQTHGWDCPRNQA